MAQKNKPELSQYLNSVLFSTTTASILKAIKQGFLKTWPVLTENLINKHIEKSRNKKVVHLYMIRHGMQSTQGNQKIHTREVRAKHMYRFLQLLTLE